MSELLTIPNAITAGFILIIVFVGLSNLFRPISNFKAVNIPNYLISLGILGTFAGIFWGLMNFDVKDIQSSVPNLIGGMKFAFGSSVAGMIFALLIKRKYIKQKIKQEINEKDSEGDAFDIENVLKAILEIRTSLVGEQNSLVNQFQELKSDLHVNMNKISRAISGDDDSSIVTQVRLLRGESRDELVKLNNAVDKFYEEIAGKATDVLLEALKTIIADFNKNLNEQFGENFKELNDAVGKILEWQIQYKEQLTAMIETQKQTSGDMKVATEAFNALLEKAESLTTIGSDFKVIVDDLSALLQALEQQRNDISNHIKLFADISEKASTGLPKIEEKISELSQDLIDVIGNHNSKINDHLETTISKSGDLNRQMSEAMTKNNTELNQHIEQAAERTIDVIENHNSKISDHLETTISKSSELNRQMSEAMTKNNEELNQHIEQAVERTNEQVVKLDQAMSEELTKALESFGKQLTSLSQTFVKDYTPLTEKLKEVVEISKRL